MVVKEDNMVPKESLSVKQNENSTTNSSLRTPHWSLDTPVQYLKGVGPRRGDLFKRLGIQTLRDLVYHFPRRHEDRRTFQSISQLIPGQKGTARGTISAVSLFRAKTGTVILQVSVRDSTGLITALWFNQPYMRKWFPVGSEIILYGTVEPIGRRFQMTVPEFELIPPEKEGKTVKSLHIGRIVPIYPATSGLHQRELRNAVAMALKSLLPVLGDPLPEAIRQRHQLIDFPTALTRIHFPPVPEAIQAAQDRVAFDELLSFQLALALRRKRLRAQPGIAHETEGDLLNHWKASLPFKFTAGQEKAVREIAEDMAAPRPMTRLLQGEVGAGKTVVAAHAVVVAAQGGSQSVIMAPTEVLARQHALTLSQFLAPIDLSVGLLTSSLEESGRRQLGKDLESGDLPVLVGTHAVLEPWIRFKKLGLVVIDEQQKFGVNQRTAILAKGDHPDLLILTATPIPRTLALTLYGEMEISTLTEKPAGRQLVRTLWMDSSRRDEVFTFVRKELEAGRQAYVVCPRIGEGTEELKVKRQDLFLSSTGSPVNATQLFENYQKAFEGYRVALLHGRMNPEEQKRIFAAFKQKEIHVLVATQVIEVGVDVANASVMVIEGAERFGLSQLHQLRGRVGRGAHESTCILISDPKSPESAERLRTLVETGDAFKIAEEDLRLRGPGELLGKRQSGVPDLKCLAWGAQGPWLETARKEAEDLLAQDPELSTAAELKKEMVLRFPKLVESCA